MKMKTKWITINDNEVCHIWVCPECKDKETVSPGFYTNNGTPMCLRCNEDMVYDHTEILGQYMGS